MEGSKGWPYLSPDTCCQLRSPDYFVRVSLPCTIMTRMAFNNLLSGQDLDKMGAAMARRRFPKAKCHVCGNTWGLLVARDPDDTSGPATVRLFQPPTYINATGTFECLDDDGNLILDDRAEGFHADVRVSYETAARWKGVEGSPGLQAVECLNGYCNHRRVLLDPEKLALRDFSTGEIFF